MPPAFRSSLVNLQQINFQDLTNSLTPEEAREPSNALLESIARTGILHPPILREQGGARLEIVTGRRRLIAAQQALQSISAICLVLLAETLPAEALAINLEDTLLRGDITVVEQAIFSRKSSPISMKTRRPGGFSRPLGWSRTAITCATWCSSSALKNICSARSMPAGCTRGWPGNCWP